LSSSWWFKQPGITTHWNHHTYERL